MKTEGTITPEEVRTQQMFCMCRATMPTSERPAWHSNIDSKLWLWLLVGYQDGSRVFWDPSSLLSHTLKKELISHFFHFNNLSFVLAYWPYLWGYISVFFSYSNQSGLWLLIITLPSNQVCTHTSVSFFSYFLHRSTYWSTSKSRVIPHISHYFIMSSSTVVLNTVILVLYFYLSILR